MSTENEVLVRRLFEEVWNAGDLNAAREIVHQDYTSSDGPFWLSTPEAGASNPGRYSEAGLETLQEEIRSYRGTYSDLRFEIERTFSEKNVVITTCRATGIVKDQFITTRTGAEMPVELDSEGMSLSRIADGKIIENRLYWPRRWG
jgi:hypothetical protein